MALASFAWTHCHLLSQPISLPRHLPVVRLQALVRTLRLPDVGRQVCYLPIGVVSPPADCHAATVLPAPSAGQPVL